MRNKTQITLSILIFALSTAILAVLLLQYVLSSDNLPQLVKQVYTAVYPLFLGALWAVPVYGYFCAALLLFIDDRHPYQSLIPFTLVLFATVVLYLHTLSGDVNSALGGFVSQHIGFHSASLILLFVLALEGVLFVIWSFNLFRSPSERKRSDNYVLGRSEQQHQMGAHKEEHRDRLGTSWDDPAVGQDDDHHFQELTLSFPHLPELPKLSIISSEREYQASQKAKQETANEQEKSSSLSHQKHSEPSQERQYTAYREVFGTVKPVDIPSRDSFATNEESPEEGEPQPVSEHETAKEPNKAQEEDALSYEEPGQTWTSPEMDGEGQTEFEEQYLDSHEFDQDDYSHFEASNKENERETEYERPYFDSEESDQEDYSQFGASYEDAELNAQKDSDSEEMEKQEESEDLGDSFIPGVAGLSNLEEHKERVHEGIAQRIGYTRPSEELLDTYPDVSSEVDRATKASGEVLMKTLREFKIEAELTGIQKGPVVTMYEILPAAGIRVQAITNLADNIALQLAASRVRMVAPIPGKQAVGIEVPNKQRSIVSFKEMLGEVDKHTKYEIPVVLGKDITGESQVVDLVRTPHLLIAGATGSGKSVCVNSLICSILYRRSPKEVRLMMVDPKIVELKLYNDIPHLLTPVITDSKKAIKALQYCLYEMERRYELLDKLHTRDIKSYNKKVEQQRLAREKLPYIVFIIDEFADLMSTSGKEIESYLARLAAMARAVGIHLVLATQRPSTNVITGIIKANIPSRIAFMVASNTDSRIILDQNGAEKLLGRGDMLFSSSWDPVLQRIQGAFLSEDEAERVVEYVKGQGEPDYLDEEMFEEDEEEGEDFTLESEDGTDPLMEEALKIVYARNSASASYLQRRLKIGYNRAARLIEEMEDRGIVGPARGSQPREVLRAGEYE